MDIDDYLKGVPERLKQIEKALGLNKTKMAEKADMKRSSYANISTGAQRASADFIYKICLNHGVSADFLIFGKGQMFQIDNEYLSSISPDRIKFMKEVDKWDINTQLDFYEYIDNGLKLLKKRLKEK